MSNTSPIGVRIASKTRYFETTGDSSYYYSSQLITNLSFLKAIEKLGQQLGWPTKVIDKGPAIKQSSAAFLAKANQSVIGSRIGHLVNFKLTPCKEWVSANHKIIEKLTTSRQFFDSKAIGFLAKSLGCVADLRADNSTRDTNQVGSIEDKSQPLKQESALSFKGQSIYPPYKNQGSYSCFARKSDPFTSFSKLAQLAKYSHSKFFRREPEIPSRARNHKGLAARVGTGYPPNGTFSQKAYRGKTAPGGRRGWGQLPYLEGPNKFKSNLKSKRRDSKQAFKTSAGLSFYLTALGLIAHCQVLRSSLVITPIGSLQSNLLSPRGGGTIKVMTSGGLGLVSSRPKCFISRSYKETTLNLFLKIPARATSKGPKPGPGTAPRTNQTFVLGDLQKKSAKTQRKNFRLKATSASVRWS